MKEKKFVAYYRVSTIRQGISGLGLEGQKNIVRGFLSKSEGKVIGEFQDILSGRRHSREGLDQAIAMCIKNRASLVVGAIDRLSRDGFKIMTLLDEAKIEYIDASSPNDEQLTKHIKFALAKDEVEKISDRIKAALNAKRERGEPLGNMANLTDEGRALGPEYKKIYARTNANSVRASVVIKALRNAGWTYQAIANELNESGFVTREGSEFFPAQVRVLYLRSTEDEKK
jgi:DNA invertase Pin-like site-specific DNA recombinase